MSPALVSEYRTRSPDNKVLQAKLYVFYELAQDQVALPEVGPESIMK